MPPSRRNLVVVRLLSPIAPPVGRDAPITPRSPLAILHNYVHDNRRPYPFYPFHPFHPFYPPPPHCFADVHVRQTGSAVTVTDSSTLAGKALLLQTDAGGFGAWATTASTVTNETPAVSVNASSAARLVSSVPDATFPELEFDTASR